MVAPSIARICTVSSPSASGEVPAITNRSPTDQPVGLSARSMWRSPRRGSLAAGRAELRGLPCTTVVPCKMAPRPSSIGSFWISSGPRSANRICAVTSERIGSCGVPISSRLPGAVTSVSTFSAVLASAVKLNSPFTRTHSSVGCNSVAISTCTSAGISTRLPCVGIRRFFQVSGDVHGPDATAMWVA